MTHCLVTARFRQTWNDVFGYVLEPGETDITLSQLSEGTGLSTKEVRGALSRLEDRYGTITTRVVRGGIKGINRRIITFCNWKAYQGDDTDQGITSLDGSIPSGKPGITSGGGPGIIQDAVSLLSGYISGETGKMKGNTSGDDQGKQRASKGHVYKKDQKEEEVKQSRRNDWEDPNPLDFDSTDGMNS